MQEQAFLAKLRRAALARTLPALPAILSAKLPLSEAERAALRLRAASKHQTSKTPLTTFAIPLVGNHQVSDWSVIEDTLARCLRALIGQSDANWRAVVCSQTRPEACDLDPRISYLPFTAHVDGHDKVAKLNALADHICTEDAAPGFCMPLDGDDLLHRDFVKALHSQGAGGLLVSSGLILNAATGDLCLTETRKLNTPTQKPFWKFCGSCMAIPTGRAPSAEHGFVTALAAHEHRLYPYLAHLAGIALHHSTTPLALYIINHGENFETRRGRGGFKQRFAKRHALTGDAKRNALGGFPDALALIRARKDGP